MNEERRENLSALSLFRWIRISRYQAHQMIKLLFHVYICIYTVIYTYYLCLANILPFQRSSKNQPLALIRSKLDTSDQGFSSTFWASRHPGVFPTGGFFQPMSFIWVKTYLEMCHGRCVEGVFWGINETHPTLFYRKSLQWVYKPLRNWVDDHPQLYIWK